MSCYTVGLSSFGQILTNLFDRKVTKFKKVITSKQFSI